MLLLKKAPTPPKKDITAPRNYQKGFDRTGIPLIVKYYVRSTNNVTLFLFFFSTKQVQTNRNGKTNSGSVVFVSASFSRLTGGGFQLCLLHAITYHTLASTVL